MDVLHHGLIYFFVVSSVYLFSDSFFVSLYPFSIYIAVHVSHFISTVVFVFTLLQISAGSAAFVLCSNVKYLDRLLVTS
jgi:hypothetical protein